MSVPTFTPHSAIGHVAYQDLLHSHKVHQWQKITGAPTVRVINGRKHWYEKFRLGEDTVFRYIGPETAETKALIDEAKSELADDKLRRSEQSRLVRVLRSEGYRTLDVGTGQLLMALSRAGVFRLGGVLVGTVAFQQYEQELGLRFSRAAILQTGDVDIASFERLSLAMQDTVTEGVDQVLGELDFAPVPSLDAKHVWKWRQTKRDTLVEFLTPSFDADEGLRDLPALGVSAQALHHLNYLIADPIPAVALYRSGILVQIPRPERFAIHKLIVADRRRDGTDSLKARKDRAQAAFLVEALAYERPDELAEAYEDALSRGPKWKQRIEASLARMPETKDRLKQVAAG